MQFSDRSQNLVRADGHARQFVVLVGTMAEEADQKCYKNILGKVRPLLPKSQPTSVYFAILKRMQEISVFPK